MHDSFFSHLSGPQNQAVSRLYRLQTEMFFPFELGLYYTSAAWNTARSVLDVGTGDAYYLSRLAGIFSEKSYVGIDTSSDILEIARLGVPPQVRLECADLYQLSGRWDFILARSVFQHLSDPFLAVKHLCGLLTPGGSLLIIDAHDELNEFWPACRLKDLYACLLRDRKTEGYHRDVTKLLLHQLPAEGPYSIAMTREIIAPSSLPDTRRLLLEYHERLIDFLEDSRFIDTHYDTLRDDWAHWVFPFPKS